MNINEENSSNLLIATGDITVYARDSVSLQPGFHTQAGSNFHAFIAYDGCSRPRVAGKSLTQNNSDAIEADKELSLDWKQIEKPLEESHSLLIYPNPNTGSCVVKIPTEQLGGSYAIVNTNGTIIQSGVFQDKTEKTFDLPNGIYYFQWRYGDEFTVKKIIVI